jgi:hypothetical protein
VAGHVKTAGAARGIRAQGVEIRGVGLASHEPASLGERLAEHGCHGRLRVAHRDHAVDVP